MQACTHTHTHTHTTHTGCCMVCPPGHKLCYTAVFKEMGLEEEGGEWCGGRGVELILYLLSFIQFVLMYVTEDLSELTHYVWNAPLGEVQQNPSVRQFRPVINLYNQTTMSIIHITHTYRSPAESLGTAVQASHQSAQSNHHVHHSHYPHI